ncbi:proto-oncogene FRAT1-like [Choloepus didactylus]|uniref:proto-oncogene FRAT1-like n=1 Tax=Choloepus didactylus TaxID=27675 RepID=UPI00189FDB8C|nr:proto-oncogene FRAT1-like [Choloepus didactylus]
MGCTAPGGAKTPSGTGRGPRPSAPRLAPPRREVEDPGSRMSCSARGAGELRAQQVAGLAVGSSALSGLGHAGPGANFSPAQSPLRSAGCPAAPGTPFPGPNRRAWLRGAAEARGLGEHRPSSSPGRSCPSSRFCPPPTHAGEAPPSPSRRLCLGRSPTSSPRCSEGNLESAGNCSDTQPTPLRSALALLKRSCSYQSPASPSPRKPRAATACREQS